ACEEEIAASQNRGAALRGRAMDRAMLANHIRIAYFHAASGLRLERCILRRCSNHRPGPDEIFHAHFHRALDYDVRLNLAAVADNDVPANHRVRTHFDIDADLCPRIDDRRRMNSHRTPASLKLKYGGWLSDG